MSHGTRILCSYPRRLSRVALNSTNLFNPSFSYYPRGYHAFATSLHLVTARDISTLFAGLIYTSGSSWEAISSNLRCLLKAPLILHRHPNMTTIFGDTVYLRASSLSSEDRDPLVWCPDSSSKVIVVKARFYLGFENQAVISRNS